MPIPQTTLPRIWLLAVLGFRIRPDHARDADHAKLLVNLHLGKDRCVSVVRTRGVIGGVCGFLLLDAVHGAVTHGIHDRHGKRSVALAYQLAVRKRDFAGRHVREWRTWHLLGQTQ
jgi:hypothetical protein